MEENLNFKKNFIWNILGTGFNAFNSLFLMIIVTRINGVNDAGIYAIAFSTACVLYVIGTYVGRVFQVTEKDKTFTDKDFIINRIISISIMIVCTIIFVIVRKYDIYKAIVFILLAIYKALEAFSDVLYGVMQRKDVLYKVGQSYFIKAILTIGVFGIVDLLTKNLIISCVSIIIVWISVGCLYDIPTVRKMLNNRGKLVFSNSLKIFKTGLYIFLITFMSIYVLNAPKYAIDEIMDDTYQAIFGIIVMPSTAICLFGQFLIHPYLNKFAELNENKKYKEIEKLQTKIISYIFLFGIVSAIIAFFIGIPVLQIIYGIDLGGYREMLVAIIIAATFYNIAMMYSNVLTTMRYTRIQFVVYLIDVIIAFFISNFLTKIHGVRGATEAYFTVMIMLFVLYFFAEKFIILKNKKNGGVD